MSSSQIFIVRDDDLGNGLNLGGGTWTYVTGNNNFGGECIFPGFAINKTSPMGSISFTFQGTSLAIWGNSPGKQESQQFQVTIDNNQPYTTSTTDTNPQHYMQWYQSPLLPSGSHTVHVGDMDGIAVDYMVFTPGPDTPLTGETLMVDDFYEGISYSGNWQASTDQTFDGNNDGGSGIGGFAFQNSSHHTTTVGDSLSFSWTGTNMSVYGIYPFNQHGSLSLSYTIDGGSPFTSQFTSQAAPAMNQQPNFQLLQTGPLAAGNHTIVMTLTANIGQTLFVDYILYKPSFGTISDMPNLKSGSTSGSTSTSTSTGSSGATIGSSGAASNPPGSTSNPSGATNNPSGATSNPSGATGITLGSSQTSSFPPPVSENSDNTTNTRTGAIAGGVVGGVVVLAILAALIFFRYRRRRSSTWEYSQEPQTPPDVRPPPRVPPPLVPDNYTVEPFSALPSVGLITSSGKHSPGLSLEYTSSASSSSFPSGAMSVAGSQATNTTSRSQLQAENRKRIEGLQSLVDAHTSGNGNENENVDELRRRIQSLTEENARLVALSSAPPAYES